MRVLQLQRLQCCSCSSYSVTVTAVRVLQLQRLQCYNCSSYSVTVTAVTVHHRTILHAETAINLFHKVDSI